MVAVRVRIACLAFALLWAQWLGLSHAIWHSPFLRGAETQHKSATKPVQQSQAQVSPSGGGLLAHDSEAQCRLFDQSAHSDALSPPVLSWVGLTPVMANIAMASVLSQALPALAYRARAPPTFLS